jgi:hypothetical protein
MTIHQKEKPIKRSELVTAQRSRRIINLSKLDRKSTADDNELRSALITKKYQTRP